MAQLMLVTGRELIQPRAWEDPLDALVRVVSAAVYGGVDVVQVREKDLPVLRLVRLVRQLRAALPPETPILLNGNSSAALQAGASGIHLPESGPATASMQQLLMLHAVPTRGGWRVGVPPPALGRSIHSVERAVQEAQEGIGYLVAGPVFETPSHPGAPGQGPGFLREVCRAVSVPVFAIGGVTPENLSECLDAGATGIAVRSPILSAEEPGRVARAYRTALDSWEAQQRSDGSRRTLMHRPPGPLSARRMFK